ncbi:hypothetical protein FO440_21715 [Mucilaginibacter corticis]|uniref:Helix-turn-helix domain-containing protein n=1 Tax=Mucilaginibacter corticis TaxID=2597670 RepID=A0A556MBS8_9SPHI|nr:hypothetical protein [Mucilaginibacter corticis]TSJ37379.1 hypothetical protein FO440_21715 [Mucilaginibacter corticis]
MAAEIITKEDLEIFGQKLLIEIKALLGKSSDEPNKWLKSYQVKNLLKISPNTLHKLRQDGTLTRLMPVRRSRACWNFSSRFLQTGLSPSTALSLLCFAVFPMYDSLILYFRMSKSHN